MSDEDELKRLADRIGNGHDADCSLYEGARCGCGYDDACVNIAEPAWQAADELERAKKIEAAANAALGYVVGDAAYQRLAAALTPDNQEEAR